MTSSSHTRLTRPSMAATVAGWIIGILPVLLLLFSASMKFAKAHQAYEGMHKLEWPDHFLLRLGVIELTCTLIYLFPPTAVLGAILLTGYLGGATASHMRVSDPQFFMPVVCGILLWLGLYLRDPRLRALTPLRK